MNDHEPLDRVDELIALAVLGELDAEQAAELDRLATEQPEVAAELRDAHDAAAALQSLTTETPDDRVRVSLLQTISSTAQTVPSAAVGAAEPGVVSFDQVRRDRAGRASGRVARRRVLMTSLAAVAAASVVAVVAVSVLRDDRTVSPVAAVVDADDAKARPLSGELDGELVVTYSAAEAAMAVSGVAEVLPEDRTYQLWLVDSTGATSVGVFRSDADGSVSFRFDGFDPSGFDPSSFDIGVTIEPAGGSSTPTLPIVASSPATV